MSTFDINPIEAKKKRLLTDAEKAEIFRWCTANPDANFDDQIDIWAEKYNCSHFSLEKAILWFILIKEEKES
jgi:hypothetical protein